VRARLTGGSLVARSPDLAYALLAATCSAEVTTEHAYLALITPPDEPDDQSEGRATPWRWEALTPPSWRVLGLPVLPWDDHHRRPYVGPVSPVGRSVRLGG
jgi:hypothetical protein